MESAESNDVVSGREVEESNACLFAPLKHVLNVVGEEGDLVHRRFTLVETRLLLRQLRIDYRVDACMEEAFHELVSDAEKRYRAVPFRIVQRLAWLWKCDDLDLVLDFFDLGCEEADGDEDSERFVEPWCRMNSGWI